MEKIDPHLLKPHPKHQQIYGDESNDHLVERIRHSGWIKTILADQNNVVIGGHRVWRATLELGISLVPIERVSFPDETAELERILLDNEHRQKTTEQLLREGEAWKDVEAAKARQRQAQGNRRELVENFPQADRGRTRDKVADRLGIGSGRTYAKGVRVLETADQLRVAGNDKAAQVLLDILNARSVDAAAKLLRFEDPVAVLERMANGEAKNVVQAQRLLIADKIRHAPQPLPTGPFDSIAVDPPWHFDHRTDDPTHRACNPYPDLAIDEIMAFPVADLAAPDAVVWLWFPNAMVPDACRVVESWGFTVKNILTWDKLIMGTGDWLRGQTEHCLMAVRGKPIVNLTNQTTLIREQRREHSRKPEKFYQLVEELCPGAKVEVFSRCERPGWTTYGAEVGKFEPVLVNDEVA